MPDKFLKLISENNGFEIELGFRDDIDHYIGGTGDTVWYCIQQKSKLEFWIADNKDGIWTDKHYKKKRGVLVSEEVESGTTIAMIMEKLYLGHDYIEKDGRKPTTLESRGMMVDHYVYKFGELAYDVSCEYGVTVRYSNLQDVENGFYARKIFIGAEVKPPKTH